MFHIVFLWWAHITTTQKHILFYGCVKNSKYRLHKGRTVIYWTLCSEWVTNIRPDQQEYTMYFFPVCFQSLKFFLAHALCVHNSTHPKTKHAPVNALLHMYLQCNLTGGDHKLNIGNIIRILIVMLWIQHAFSNTKIKREFRFVCNWSRKARGMYAFCLFQIQNSWNGASFILLLSWCKISAIYDFFSQILFKRILAGKT